MTRSQAVCAGVAGMGVLVVVVGGVLSRTSVELGEATHAVGLLLMLVAGCGFLLARYFIQRPWRKAPLATAPSGTRETARHLILLGAVVFAIGVGMTLGLNTFISPTQWLFWIFVSWGLLGLGAIAFGALTYAATLVFGENQVSSEPPRRVP